VVLAIAIYSDGFRSPSSGSRLPGLFARTMPPEEKGIFSFSGGHTRKCAHAAVPVNHQWASILNFIVEVFPPLNTLTAMFQEPDMERFILAAYDDPLSEASAL